MCERNIPWSQQVDEASYENLASPTSHEDNPGAHQNSMQFQYPPFNAKENQDVTWNNFKPRKSNNYESNKKYGKTTFHNNSKREDTQSNAWGPPNTRRNFTESASANYNRANRSDENYSGSGKLDNIPNNNVSTDDKRANAPTVAPKKTTWASIASQPAKLTSRTTLATSSQKKKGPGMPPPPMVPGKHDLDVNSWDLPNNNPPPVPSPPPPVDSSPNLSSDFSLGYMTTADSETGRNFDRGQPTSGINYDLSRDDVKSNYNNGSYGRSRHSPNGHPRKNWSSQHPLNQNRQKNLVPGGPTRRNEGGNSVSFGLNRYANDRRGNYSHSRSEFEGDVRDENSPRNVDRTSGSEEVHTESPQAVLDELRDKNNYNPVELELETAATARFFVIKSYSEDDIHRSIKYEIWCSTPGGNKRLDEAFKERQKEGGNILLFFSVNGSGHFCGMAQMMTSVDYNSTSSVWSQDKWKGKFKVKWIYVKDVPNNKLRHIRLENNDNKSVTNSRDTQEVPNAQGIEVLQILHSFQHVSSIFDDFIHYEVRQKEEVSSKKPVPYEPNRVQSPTGRQQFSRQNDDRFLRDRDGRSGGAQKYFPNSGTSFRDRNSRSNYHSNSNSGGSGNFHRNSDYHHPQRERDSSNAEREIYDHGNRYVPKFDFNRRDERALPKLNNREREQRSAEFSDSEHNNKGDLRFRSGLREPQKDNENAIAERPRGNSTSASDY